MRPDRDLLERGPHEDPVSALAGVGSCSFVRRESLQRSARFAPFGPSGVGVAIRLRPLRPTRISCTLFPRGWSPALCGARRFGLLRVRRLAFAASCGLLRPPLCLPCAACRFDSTVGTLRCRLPWRVPLPDCSGYRPLRFRWPAFTPCFEAALSDHFAAQRLRALPRSQIAPRSMPVRRVVCRLLHA